MADTLVERVTGQAVASEVSVEVQVVMTDRTLLAEHGEPAYLHGYGVVPAAGPGDWCPRPSEARGCVGSTPHRRPVS